MTTFDESRYMDITFYLDGSIERDDEIWDYKKELERMDKRASELLSLLRVTGDIEKRNEINKTLGSLIKLKKILENIWGEDIPDFEEIEEYEE